MLGAEIAGLGFVVELDFLKGRGKNSRVTTLCRCCITRNRVSRLDLLAGISAGALQLFNVHLFQKVGSSKANADPNHLALTAAMSAKLATMFQFNRAAAVGRGPSQSRKPATSGKIAYPAGLQVAAGVCASLSAG